jgi:hypothetical protein
MLVIGAPSSLRGTSIPITKRSSMSNPDGSVNFEALKRHATYAEQYVSTPFASNQIIHADHLLHLQ